MTKVAIAMSGGIDSSVTAAILKDQGYDCFGVHMHNGTASAPKNIEDAAKSAKKIGIPFYVIDLKKVFEEKILKYYLDTYKKGHTPNPCVVCNKYVKFGELMTKVRGMGADFLATGHYARIKKNKNIYELHAGADPKKDQSYFLYRLTQAQLKHVMFPLGDTTKEKTKAFGKEYGLRSAIERDESQGICFIPDKFYTDFLKNHLPKSCFEEGLIIDMDGTKRGRHRGLPYYTCGQRKGLFIGGLKEPYYVIKTDYKNNTLFVGGDKYLWHKEIYAKELSFISGKTPSKTFTANARTRHLGTLEKAKVEILNKNTAKVVFAKPVRAFTEGQSIVFYKGSKVIGGGTMRWNQ
ncbi:MAG: tRNA-specific 2-thiouridylase MnmA [uncultured bacterium]|nr:MAG: tRNA-specific 2-thiouridylase MnmA [uncultured bacterium]KKT02636.1 MAG: tRNA-specific 2-thiouridylase tRNA-specific 2-thiouridylase [Candidatus Peregrinibacteria bacterium GW2011_GWF2_43_17]HAU39852.1 tRNA 2-thiouridine(34) synthase MnmA [Candidatus Peregrinibacteria bacterium]